MAKLEQNNDPSATNNEANVVDIMNRLASTDFPPELLLQVVETAAVSQVGHWKVTDPHDLGALAESLFACPEGVADTTRRLLQQTAETALLKRCIVRIKYDVDESEPPRYKYPPALLGRESHVSHLVIDLSLHTDTPYSEELLLCMFHMDNLAEAFPRVAVCTFLIHIEYDALFAFPGLGTPVDAAILDEPDYTFQKHIMPSRVFPKLAKCKREDNFVGFIAAFAKSGLGRRKLIRFSRETYQSIPSSGIITAREFRSLVRVSTPDVPSTTDATKDSLIDEEKQSIINAKRILDEAYRGEWKSR